MEHNTEVQTQQDKGFTLVELLIVIVILGILATVTVFAVRGITDQGQSSACDADQKTLETAAETWFAQYGGTAIPVTGGTMPASAPAEFVAAGLGANPEATLVNAGFLRGESSNFTLAANGDLTIQAAACGTVGAAVG